jgi:hypothetical protein
MVEGKLLQARPPEVAAEAVMQVAKPQALRLHYNAGVPGESGAAFRASRGDRRLAMSYHIEAT